MTHCIAFSGDTTAGLTFRATVSPANHPAPAWSIALHLRGPSQIDLTGAPDGTGFTFAATAATTAGWTPGEYWWTLRATNGADVVEIERGTLAVLPDLAAVSSTFDGHTASERALAAIDAVLARRATIDQQRYTINNRELWRTPIADLIKLRAFYAAAVGREKGKASGSRKWGRAVPVRFS